METKKFIDIEEVIRSKNPKLLKWMPKFILNYLKKIIHENEINAFLEEHKDKKNADFCEEVIRYFNINVKVNHIERIPKSGKVVLAMNHPLGGMDAMILVSALRGHRNDLKFIVNDILMNLTNLEDLFVGVNKHGKNRSSTRSKIRDLFASDHAVSIFPAGLVSRKTNGVVRDLEWKKTFVMYSKEYDRTVIPIHIDGHLSNFFYRLSNLRKFLGIKANIEMLFLANELFKQKNRTMEFTIGNPINREWLAQFENDHIAAQEVKKCVYLLEQTEKES